MSLRLLEALFFWAAHTLKWQTWQVSMPMIILLWEKIAFLFLPSQLPHGCRP